MAKNTLLPSCRTPSFRASDGMSNSKRNWDLGGVNSISIQPIESLWNIHINIILCISEIYMCLSRRNRPIDVKTRRQHSNVIRKKNFFHVSVFLAENPTKNVSRKHGFTEFFAIAASNFSLKLITNWVKNCFKSDFSIDLFQSETDFYPIVIRKTQASQSVHRSPCTEILVLGVGTCIAFLVHVAVYIDWRKENPLHIDFHTSIWPPLCQTEVFLSFCYFIINTHKRFHQWFRKSNKLALRSYRTKKPIKS